MITAETVRARDKAIKALASAWEDLEVLRVAEEEASEFATERGHALKILTSDLASLSTRLVDLYT